MESPDAGAAAQVPLTDARAAAVASEDAATLETAGVRSAAVLETAGVREADVLRTAGIRDAEALEAASVREASILRTQGQRLINLIWENTQRQVALAVIGGALVVAGSLAIFGRWLGSNDLQLAAVVFLFGVANLVTGFYFGRTNHARVGGVGGESSPHDR